MQKQIESFKGVAKRALDSGDLPEVNNTPNPQRLYIDPVTYADVCEEYKLGEQNNYTLRLLCEWDLSSITDSIYAVTSATVKFYPDQRDIPFHTSVGLVPYISINYQPTVTHLIDYGDSINYNNCSNPVPCFICEDENEQKTFSLSNYHRGKIKDRMNDNDNWYAVGYRLWDESQEEEYRRLTEGQNYLYFDYTAY